jgi:hypothetical protein
VGKRTGQIFESTQREVCVSVVFQKMFLGGTISVVYKIKNAFGSASKGVKLRWCGDVECVFINLTILYTTHALL